jgi:hypothetical protein
VRTFAKFLEGPVPDLANSFAGDTEEGTDLLEGAFLAVVETVIKVQNLTFAFGQVTLEHRFEEIAAGDRLDVFFDVPRVDAGEALSEGRAVPVTSINRGIEGEFARGDPP